MDYEHDDRRAADVPGATGAEGSGVPEGREPLDAGLPSSQADDLFDAMFLTGGLRPPAFAAVDHDLGFPPPQAPDLASAFLAALDAIDDRRFVTPVPDDSLPLAPVAPPVPSMPLAEPLALAPLAEPAYELRPQSRFELESEATSDSVDETLAAPVAAEDAVRLPWDTARIPVAGLLEESFEKPIEEAAYYAAGIDGDAGDADDDEAAAPVAAEAEAESEAVAAAAAQADADVEAGAAEAEAVAEAEALALALAEAEARAAAEQAELEAAIAAEAALDEASSGAPASPFAAFGSTDAFASSAVSAASAGFSDVADGIADEFTDEISDEAPEEAVAGAFDAALEDDVFDMAFGAGLDAVPDAIASASASSADLTPGDDDFELEPSIGSEPMDAAPMAFDGPDAFAPAPVAAAAPEPEPESDELEDLQDYVVFSLGDMRCVVPIRNVVEVGRIPDAAPVPNAPVWLYGLGNLRGQVLSLIDLRAFFGVGRIKASAGRMVVLRGDSDDITAGVMVDQVHQIVALSPSRFKDAPAELPLPEKTTEFVWGACDYGNYTMIGLDVDGVLGVENLTEEAV